MNEILKRLLEKRELDESFLTPKYEDLASPREFLDMEQAGERIAQAVEQGERVLIYGDYDADGVTATTIMYDALKLAGVREVLTMLPDRFRDGYGMNMRVVDLVEKSGVNLVITVDCGSNNAEVVEALGARGVNVIVTDHHEVMGELPQATAIINPKREGTKNLELRELCGAGVAFMVARELVERGLIPKGQEKWLLDLVLIGTLCDSMVMRGQNRILGFYGLKVLEKTRRMGLLELMKVAGVKQITSGAVGFQIGPRLNAAGRMASAEVALKLLMAKTRVEAVALAAELEALNQKRREEQQRGAREVEEQGVDEEPVIVVAGDWHEGVLGIIAGRLVEKYRRPAFVLAPAENGEILKGSGRSFGEFNLAEALSECQNSLLAGGGHAGACGVKVLKENLPIFREEVNKFYKKLGLKNQERFLEKQADINVTEVDGLDINLYEQLKKLEPFGEGNLEPVFRLSEMTVLKVQRMGREQNHLRLVVRGESDESMSLVAFYALEEWLEIQVGERIDVSITLTDNEWRGERRVEGQILEMIAIEQ